ncbi:MAG TPA: CHAP domain-containing protein [Candidatus Saccharimonadales bacterium]|nr:CHAP domain-containing protein [Candidatus Saccharimonadales bacterium]
MGSAQAATAELKQEVFARHKNGSKKAKGMPKSTTIAAYAGVFLLVMSIVAVGYQPPQKMDSVANAAVPAQSTTSTTAADQPSVDQLVATNIAAGIAERADLPIATNVANLSLSLSAESQLAQNDNSNAINKPQIIQPTSGSRELKRYTAKAGDTVESLAQQFGVSSNTIKWANSLNSDAIEKDKQLVIPPVDGIVYVAKDGDTVDSIASKYQASKDRIVSFNDLELGGLANGRALIIPGGVLPETERPGYVAPRNAASQGSYGGGYSTVNSQIARASAGNRYASGNCTWYAYERRVQLGRPVGSFWGNAATWSKGAREAGYQVDNKPSVGAIMQNGGGYGHVAIVESIGSDGSLTLSEMNYAGNYNRVTSRTVSAGTAAGFTYIH